MGGVQYETGHILSSHAGTQQGALLVTPICVGTHAWLFSMIPMYKHFQFLPWVPSLILLSSLTFIK